MVYRSFLDFQPAATRPEPTHPPGNGLYLFKLKNIMQRWMVPNAKTVARIFAVVMLFNVDFH